MQKEYNLSKNQKIIFDLIDKSGGPMKAYSILFNVQKKGIKAPLQVYRALDKLVEIGKIHKIESRNAFIACQNSSCQISKATAFSICESCENLKLSQPFTCCNVPLSDETKITFILIILFLTTEGSCIRTTPT